MKNKLKKGIPLLFLFFLMTHALCYSVQGAISFDQLYFWDLNYDGGAFCADISPNGNIVVFNQVGADLYFYNANTGITVKNKQITNTKTDNEWSCVKWLPNSNSEVMFTDITDYSPDVFILGKYNYVTDTFTTTNVTINADASQGASYGITVFDISYDGRYAVIGNEQNFYVVDFNDNTVEASIDEGNNQYPQFPDNYDNHEFFFNNGTHMFVYDCDTGLYTQEVNMSSIITNWNATYRLVNHNSDWVDTVIYCHGINVVYPNELWFTLNYNGASKTFSYGGSWNMDTTNIAYNQINFDVNDAKNYVVFGNSDNDAGDHTEMELYTISGTLSATSLSDEHQVYFSEDGTTILCIEEVGGGDIDTNIDWRTYSTDITPYSGYGGGSTGGSTQDATYSILVMGMDCPSDATAQVNHSYNAPVIIVGPEGSYGDYIMYNETGVEVWRKVFEGGNPNAGIMHWDIPFGYGTGLWYIEMRDNLTSTLFGTCYILVYYDVGYYGLIFNKTFYMKDEWISFEFLAPDDEQIHIYDSYGYYDVYLYGTGNWVTVKQAFQAKKSDVLKLYNATNVFKADQFFTVVDEYGYTELYLEHKTDFAGNNIINNGDLLRFYGVNGYKAHTNFKLYLILTNEDSTAKTVVKSWDLNNYPEEFSIDHSITNIGNYSVRFAYYTYADGYTYLDDFYIPFRVYPFEEPDPAGSFGYGILPPISQPLGSIIGMGIVMFCTLTPFILAGAVGNTTGHKIEVPSPVYMFTGGLGLAISVVLNLFPSWVPYFLISLGIIVLVFYYMYGKKEV